MEERQNGGGTRNGTVKKVNLKKKIIQEKKEGRKEEKSLSHTNKILSRKDRNSRTFW